MLIVRYDAGDNAAARVGLLQDDHVRQLSAVASVAELLRLRVERLRSVLTAVTGPNVPVGDVRLLAPVDGRTEVWAAGVTYRESRTARVAESERSATVYEQVYDAPRPELFFKSVPWKVTGPDGVVGVRDDSTVDVPEPELAIAVTAYGEIAGYTICDDVSSRSIEGENPLYLPQAKVFAGACALGPGIRPVWEVPDPYTLTIRLTIHRGGQLAWSGEANTSQLNRRLEELVDYLTRGDEFGDGAVLSTGTCLVPGLPFSLTAGDRVEIGIDGLGTLRTDVARGLAARRQARTGGTTKGQR